MRISDAVPALFILALSALAVIGTWDLSYWSGTTPGPSFLPSWVAGVTLPVVALGLVEAWRGGGSHAGSGTEWPDRPALLRAALAFAGLVTIALLIPVLGMVPGIVLFVAFLLVVVLRRPLWPSLAAVFVTGGVMPTHVAMVRKPLYHGAIDIHGAAPSPDDRLIATTGRGTSNVYLIDTASMRVVGNQANPQAGETTNKERLTSGVLVGREPHEPAVQRARRDHFFSPCFQPRVAPSTMANGPTGQRKQSTMS